MKRLKLFFACLLMAVLSIGQVYGAVYFEDTFSDVGTASSGTILPRTGWSGSGTTAPQANTGVRIGASSSGATLTKSAMSNIDGTKNLKVTIYVAKYNKDASTLTVTATNGAISDKTGVGTLSAGTLTISPAANAGVTSTTAAATWTDDFKTEFIITGASASTTISFASNKRLVLGPVTIEDAPATTTPTIGANPGAAAFGTKNIYYEGNKSGSLDIAVSGSNLTGNITAALSGDDASKFSILGAPFAPTAGEASGTLTVSYAITEEGEYSASLTLSSDGATSVVIPITLSAVSVAPAVYVKVTSASELSAGDKIVIVNESYNKAAGVISGTLLSVVDITDALDATLGKLTITTEAVQVFTLGGEEGAWTLTSADGQLSSVEAKKMLADGETTWAITISSGDAAPYVSSTVGTLQYNDNSGNGRFTTYTSTQEPVQFYKFSDGKEPASLAYAAADAQKLVKVGGSLTAPTLTNPHNLTVSYASSNESVVKVNASTGEITEIVAAGKAVITASSAETSEYKAGSASYTIFVASEAGTAEDPLTEASAKALIDLGCTLTAHVNGVIATPSYYSTSQTYTVTLTNGFQFFKLKDLGNVLFTSDYLKAGDEVTAVGPLSKYGSSYQLGEGCYLTFYEQATTPLTPIANDEATAYTVEQALIYAAAPTTYDLSDIVYVRGKVAIASTALFNSKYLTYSISDDGTTTNVLKIYNGLGIDGAAFESKDDILVGDVVVVKGNLTQHNTELELAANNELVSKKPVATIAIDNMALEYAEEATISATITPAAAASTVLYSIKAGGDDVITLEGNKITAKSATGTATIVATIATTDDYEGASIEFTVSVSEGDTRKTAVGPAEFTTTSGFLTPSDILYISHKGGASTAPGNYNSGIRLYQISGTNTYGGYVTLIAKKGCKIDEVEITTTNKYATTVGYYVDADEAAIQGPADVAKSGTYNTATGLNADSVRILNLGTGSNGRLEIASITVYYTGDAAAVDHYELGGTYQTEFEIGDEFNHDGLSVYMAYDAGGTEKLDLTAGCTFSDPDMTVDGTPTVEISFGTTVIKSYDITVAASALLDPELSYDPTSVTLTQGDELSAPTLNNPHTLDLTFNSNKTSVATVDEFGVITLAGGTGTATITASFAGDATYQAGNATFTITVNEPEEDLTGTWEFATSVAAGDRIIIASIAEAGEVTTMGAQGSSNRGGVASTVAGTELTPAAGSKSVTLVDAGEGKFALQLNNGSYLYASSNSSNQLKETAAYADNENAKWTFAFDGEGVATITAQGANTHNVMRYNPNSGSPLFNCYTSSSTTGTLVTIYKKATPEPAWEQVRDELVIGRHYTVCLEKNITAIDGATFWSLSKRNEAGTAAYLESEDAPEAGKPYIIQATKTVLKVVYGENVETAPVENGALRGTFTGLNASQLNAINVDPNVVYMLFNNELRPIGTNNHLDAHRAYVLYNQLEPVSSAPNAAPGKRVKSMPMQRDAAQGFENIESGDKPMKVMIEGTMYILRGEKVYDATGRLVK